MAKFIPSASRFVLKAAVASCLATTLSAAEPENGQEYRAPAGQVCPSGSFVIGFDGEANILCSAVCGNGVLDSGEACDDGNTKAGDGCSATCQSEGAAPAAAAAVVAAETVAEGVDSPPSAAGLAISRIEPRSVLYGSREVTLTVHGTGFGAESVIVFQGNTYPPTVNPSGTQLVATLPTRDLAMGFYAITVSNGPEAKNTLKKALQVY